MLHLHSDPFSQPPSACLIFSYDPRNHPSNNFSLTQIGSQWELLIIQLQLQKKEQQSLFSPTSNTNINIIIPNMYEKKWNSSFFSVVAGAQFKLIFTHSHIPICTNKNYTNTSEQTNKQRQQYKLTANTKRWYSFTIEINIKSRKNFWGGVDTISVTNEYENYNNDTDNNSNSNSSNNSLFKWR